MRYSWLILLALLTQGFHNCVKAQVDSLFSAYSKVTEPSDQLELLDKLVHEAQKQEDKNRIQYLLEERLSTVKSQHAASLYNLLGKIHISQAQFIKADSLLHLSLCQNQSKKEEKTSYLFLSQSAMRQSHTNQEETYLKELRRTIGSDTLSKEMAYYYMGWGCLLLKKTQYIPALDALLSAKKILKAGGQDLSGVNHNLSIVYSNLGYYEEALSLAEENLAFAKDKQDYFGQLFAYFAIAGENIRLGHYTKAKKACLEAVELKEQKGISTAFGYIYYCLGDIYHYYNQLDSAIFYYNEGITISSLQEEKKELADNHTALAELYFGQNDLIKATDHIQKAKESRTYEDIGIEVLYAKILAQQQDYTKAYATLQNAWEATEALNDSKTQNQVISTLLEEKFTKEREQEQLVFSQKSRSQQARMGILLMAICLGILIFFISLQRRHNQKLKRLNESLLKQNKALEQFTHITSHDLKEPLRNISSFSSLLQRKINQKFPEETSFHEYLQFIQKNAENLIRIIQSLGVYTKISTKSYPRESFPVDTLFERVQQNLWSLIEQKNAVVSFKNLTSSQQLNTSQDLLVLVLQNLIQNGLKYNDTKEPKIVVTLEEEEKQLFFRVKDNGVGIDLKYQEYIFRPFAALSNKTSSQSSGLGLAIVQSILEKLDQRLWIQSKINQGSEFCFTVQPA